MEFPPSAVFGMKVFLDPLLDPAPKLQLSPGFNAVSPEFKAKFNAWLVERFGYNPPEIYMVAGNVSMGPRTYQIIRAKLPQENLHVKS